jgi:hypothetical protein
VAVQFFGIYGVLIGTVMALLYRANDMVLYASHKILMKSAKKTYKLWLTNLAIFVTILYLNRFITVNLTSYVRIILFCVPYTICTLVIFFGIILLTNRETAKDAFAILKGSIRGRK